MDTYNSYLETIITLSIIYTLCKVLKHSVCRCDVKVGQQCTQWNNIFSDIRYHTLPKSNCQKIIASAR